MRPSFLTNYLIKKIFRYPTLKTYYFSDPKKLLCLKCRITRRGPCLRVETCSEIKVKSKTKVLNLLVDTFSTSLTIVVLDIEK
jgi:hypothetical protein